MASIRKSVTQCVWERIALTPQAVHSILPYNKKESEPFTTSRVPNTPFAIKPVIRRGTVSITQEEVGHIIAEATLFLKSKGLKRGDRVGIIGWDSLYWLAFDRAAEGMGLIAVALHPNSTKEQNVHVLNDSQLSLLVGESQDILDNLIDLTQFKRVRLIGQEVAADQTGLDNTLETATFGQVFQYVPDFTAPAPGVCTHPVLGRLTHFRKETVEEFSRLKAMFTTTGAALPFEMNDPNTIIYTSGSTGLPKGVVHTHKSEAAICEILARQLPGRKRWKSFLRRLNPFAKADKRGRSFGPQHIILHLLPWSHIYGKTNGKALAEYMGCINAYADPMTFQGMLRIIAPDILLAVPLLWNRLKKGIEKQLAEGRDLFDIIAEFKAILKGQGFKAAWKAFKTYDRDALKLAAAKWAALWVKPWSESAYQEPQFTEQAGFGRRLLHRLSARLKHWAKPIVRFAARKLICPGILHKAGLNNIVLSVSGSAAIPIEIVRFFEFLGVTLREGYGSSETGGGWCLNLIDDNEFSSLGKPLPGAKIRIVPVPGMPEGTGLLEVQGDFVFAGYWRNPEKTAEVLTEDGWFKMGDTVRKGKNGRLWFESRGNMKKLLTGEFYSEERVQTALEGYSLFAAAVVTGEGYPCIGALLWLDSSYARHIAPLPDGCQDQWQFWQEHPEILSACEIGVAEANRILKEAPESLAWEQVKVKSVCPGELTIENGLRLNTNKPNIRELRRRFAEYITRMHTRP